MLAATVIYFLIPVKSAQADGGFRDGRWRLQINGEGGIDSDRSGDLLTLATVEYEFPAITHVTLGLKLHPFFSYSQDEFDLGHDFKSAGRRILDAIGDEDERGGDTVLGGGFGIGTRIYQVKEENRGLFLDLGISALFHSGEINHNSASIDFMSGLGLGYQFKFGLSTQVRIDHLSNAGIGDENRGTNVVGLGVGFRF